MKFGSTADHKLLIEIIIVHGILIWCFVYIFIYSQLDFSHHTVFVLLCLQYIHSFPNFICIKQLYQITPDAPQRYHTILSFYHFVFNKSVKTAGRTVKLVLIQRRDPQCGSKNLTRSIQLERQRNALLLFPNTNNLLS